jgi:hypothetical protein
VEGDALLCGYPHNPLFTFTFSSGSEVAFGIERVPETKRETIDGIGIGAACVMCSY